MTDNQTTVTAAPVSDAAGDAESLTAVEGLVQRLSTQLDELKVKQKELSDMLKGVFDNDEEFNTAQTAAQEAGKALKDRLTALNGSQQVQELRAKLTDLREDMKMVQESLNTHLVNYFQMTGATSFPTADGNERDFTLQAKLKPPRQEKLILVRTTRPISCFC